MERRPKPAEPALVPTEVQSAQAVPAEASPTGESAATVLALEREATAPTSDKALEAETTDTPLPEPAVAASSELAASAPEPPQPDQPPINVEETPSLAYAAERPDGDVAGTQPPPDDAAKAPLAAEEFIEIWRPGRRDEHARKPRRERRPRQRRPQRDAQPPPVAADPAAASPGNGPAPAAAAESAPPDRSERPDRRRGAGAPERRSPRPKRAERPQRDGERSRGDRRAPRGDRPDRDPALRAKYMKGRSESAARREPDPNSPFAKLAALKEQLEASNKEPR
jgi:ATP-dependent RNA helicase SUPV3L1/SUV3